MKYISETTEFQLKNSVVTLGKFDGLHIGHQMLLSHVLELKQGGYQSVMFTFDLHPANLFSEKEIKLIYTNEEKMDRLKELGFDVLISYPFSKQTASLSPESFIKEVLVEKLDVKAIVVGKDYRFGKGRRGNVTMLEQYAKEYGYEVYSYDKVMYEEEIVSSTRIRDCIALGKMEQANAMLGRAYSVQGKVLHGRKLGRTLGMPTTNLQPSEMKLLPPNGVYATITWIGNQQYYGVSNVGLKPTVGGQVRPGVETYLFDFEGDLYGKEIKVDFYQYQRKEMKFSSVEELKSHMQHDIRQAKEYFRIVTE